MPPSVIVIIVNYNGLQWLAECLKSLDATRYDNFEIVFVDNGSSDDSVAFVGANFPEVVIIQNDRNLGFCEGNNIGISKAINAQAEYIVLLNNDTKVTENWLSELVKVGEECGQVGILGSVQMSYSGTDFNSWTRTIAKEHLQELSAPETARSWIPMPWVEGSCFAIKRQVINEVGMLDPIYFMYFEEIDYCRRAMAHGYEVALVPRSRIHHFRGGSTRLDPAAKRLRALRYDRSNLIYHLTDLRHSFAVNFLRYGFAVLRRCFSRIGTGSYQRLWDLVVLQPELLGSFSAIRGKWKADRLLVTIAKDFDS